MKAFSFVSVYCAFSTLIMLNGCGHQQRFRTGHLLPTLHQVVSSTDGIDLYFEGNPSRQIKVWVRKGVRVDSYQTRTKVPLTLTLRDENVEIRYAYVLQRDGVDYLGELSEWQSIQRLKTDAYPTVNCQRKGSAMHVFWEPPQGSTYEYSGWGVSYDGVRTELTLPVAENKLSLERLASTIWVFWFSEQLRGPMRAISCSSSTAQ